MQEDFSGVRCVDVSLHALPLHMAAIQKSKDLSKQQDGWMTKSQMLYLSSFQEVLVLDSDNVPLKDPAFLFDTKEYKSGGNLFWPDFWTNNFHNPGPAYSLLGMANPWLADTEISTTESGQFLIDRWVYLIARVKISDRQSRSQCCLSSNQKFDFSNMSTVSKQGRAPYSEREAIRGKETCLWYPEMHLHLVWHSKHFNPSHVHCSALDMSSICFCDINYLQYMTVFLSSCGNAAVRQRPIVIFNDLREACDVQATAWWCVGMGDPAKFTWEHDIWSHLGWQGYLQTGLSPCWEGWSI